jgi:hypothetical protein
MFMATISALFGYYLYNIEVKNECLVRKDYSVPENAALGASDDPNIQNVSYDFDLVLSMFFLQAVTGAATSCYSVLSIYCFPIFLKVSYPVGVFNKLNLLFGAGCMFFMHYYRFSHGGKVCSGDYLSDG